VAFDGSAGGVAAPPGPVVAEGGVGPYDYAVLKADSKDDMLNWLTANHYYVPVGTDDAVGNYIHPGAYFLALKLMPGKSSGDIQPIVVHYASDLPMIPLVLTSATATADMPVWVWLLADARAVPRNYYHVVLDDAALGWHLDGTSQPYNYEAQVAAAVREAPGNHAFATEFAGVASGVRQQLFPTGQFGDLTALAALTNTGDYLRYLKSNNYPFGSTLVSILAKYMAQPPGLGVDAANYFYNFDYWYAMRPWAFQGVDLSFDPVALTDEIDRRLVTPMRAAARLFQGVQYLTRLHTVISPIDMTRDPVFGQNPFLPDVSPAHAATMQYRCTDQPYVWDGVLNTEQGFAVPQSFPAASRLPASLRVEILREDGLPEVLVDHTGDIRAALGAESTAPDAGVSGGGGAAADSPGFPSPSPSAGGGCALAPPGRPPLAGALALGGLSLLGWAAAAAAAARHRRRSRGSHR
jgi:hypothetical protein